MKGPKINSSDDQLIGSVQEWFELSSPAGGKVQWKDGRSAKELAKAWFRGGYARVPNELTRLLESHPMTHGLTIGTGIPELKTPLDDFRGNTRNHDMILLAHDGEGKVLVSIEAKSDEEFGPLVGRYHDERLKKSSKAPDRIQLLCRSLFGRDLDEELRGLRYQLFHALAATLIEARNQGAALAVFVVHEFLSDRTDWDRVRRNAGDFERFIRTLTGKQNLTVEPGTLLGPYRVPGGEFVPGDMPFLIGKVTKRLDRLVEFD